MQAADQTPQAAPADVTTKTDAPTSIDPRVIGAGLVGSIVEYYDFGKEKISYI